MGDEYLVRSGAKDLLARTVASLLEIRPANPVLFLAHSFDTTASSVERSVRLLRACSPSTSAFQDALHQAFRWLSVTSSPTTDPLLMETLGLSIRATIPRSRYDQVVHQLCTEYPQHVKDRISEAFQSPMIRSDGMDVSFDEFKRGVQICVLLEALFDVVEELFLSIDKGGIGEIKLGVVVSVLGNAAQHAKQHGRDDVALELLKRHLGRCHDVAFKREISSTEAAPTSPSPSPKNDHQRFLRLVDLQETVFNAVFTP